MPNLGFEATPPQLKSPEALVGPRLAEAYRAWIKLSNGRFAPTRGEISPRVFKSVLPTVFLLDVIDAGSDFRFALGGDKILRFLMDRLSPGMLLSKVSGSLFYERATRLLRYCVDTMLPVAGGPSRAHLEGREFLLLEVLALPVSNDGETVTSILGAIQVGPLKSIESDGASAGKMPTAFPVKAARVPSE